MEKFNVLILGHGEIARAIAHLLAPRHVLQIWTRRPAPGSAAVDLEVAAARADFIFFCLPTAPHFELATRLRPHLAPQAICVSVAKGLDDRGRNAAQALAAGLVEHACGVLCGPMIAEEILLNRPGFAQFASQYPDAVARVARLFAGSNLRVERADNPVAASWAAVMKNVYAIAIGVADGLGLGVNVRGYLAVIAQREAAALIARLTGRSPPCYELASLGDLITTATSADSRHHSVGMALARGETGPLVCEGVHTIEIVQRLDLVTLADFPLCNFTAMALKNRGDLTRAFLRLLLDDNR